MTVVNLNPRQMQDFDDSRARMPAMAKLYEFEAAAARQQGGFVLEVWELHQGQLFGKPWMMTLDEVAKRLSVPVSRVADAVNTVDGEAVPRWKATPEYRASEFAQGE